MSERKDEFSKEKWLWKTYGEGVRDALKRQPGRTVRMIHRYHQTGQDEIFQEFKDYPGPFDLSFKYSIAHMYSIPNPPYIKSLLPVLPPGRKTWLTVRNDDVYSFRWADPAYARAYIQNIPSAEKIAGFYMGPDGYVWGREYLSTEPDLPRQPVISKQWFSFLLWGRLAFDPQLPDARFREILAQRFAGVDAQKLLEAWSASSQVFPLITRFFWGDIDLRWFPEACLSHPRYRGYYTVRDFVEGQTMPGSDVMPILEWRRRKLAGEALNGTGPMEIAEMLEKNAIAALGALPMLRQGTVSKELRLTLGDIEAMSHLSAYYAAKIRAAAALGLFDRNSQESERQQAIAQLEKAAEAWRSYAKAYTAQYTTPHLYNRVGYVDMNALLTKAQADVDIARQWKPGTIPGDTPRRNASDLPFRK